jgi:hypothetical protein
MGLLVPSRLAIRDCEIMKRNLVDGRWVQGVILALAAQGWLCWGGLGLADQAGVPSFAKDIRPILADACFNCHGFDAAERKAGLRLDTPEGAYEDLGGVRALVPGDLEASELWYRVTTDDEDDVMPPPDFPHQLDAGKLDLLKRWIEAGAEYEEHWAFRAPVKADLPGGGEGVHPVDAFVLARLGEEGKEAAGGSDKRSLIRRVSLGLTGLPPTPEEVAAYLADETEEAYGRVVDRLLGSERHAEHMARYWLDAARYADTHGYQYDLSRSQWPWRDWVIAAYRDNMPFDQFTIEQMAGDLLPDATESQVLATGFHRNHPITIEGGIIDEEYRTEYVIDRVATTGTVWMGLTMACARCHDHKFDPISMDDFYSFYAYFNRVPERGHGGQNKFAPTRAIASPLQGDQLAGLRQQIGETDKELAGYRERIASRRGELEEQLRGMVPSFRTVVPEAVATGGSTLEEQEDGSLLAVGAAPGVDHYEFVLGVEGPVGALRVEALTDGTLPGGSVGRASNGNFVLTRLRVWSREVGGKDAREVVVSGASASYEQGGYPVADALVDNGKGGWGVDGNMRAEASHADFVLEGLGDREGGWELVVRLDFGWGGGHAIGRPRLAVSAAGSTGLTADVVAALELGEGERSDEQRELLERELLIRAGVEGVAGLVERRRELERRIGEMEAARPEVMIMQDIATPPATYVLNAGLYDEPNKERPVSARPPGSFLVEGVEGFSADRLGLARWIVAPDNPLTARTVVNRMWQQLFGIGIVASADDLGTQGELPSHPELLDWLAVELMESGWDIRAMMRLLVTSATYRQSSEVAPEAYREDPDNRLLARGPRQRLDAEAIRDNSLAVAGLLDATVGGPSVYPYHPEGLWEEVNNRPGLMEEYKQSEGAGLYRRSMYTFWKRAVPPPSMQTFDAPNREYCVVRRGRTNTPVQALVLLHEPGQVEAARGLAGRMVREGGDTVEGRLARGFELATARLPKGEELGVLVRFFSTEAARFAEDPGEAERLMAVGELREDVGIGAAELASYTSVARLLLNLDETITQP